MLIDDFLAKAPEASIKIASTETGEVEPSINPSTFEGFAHLTGVKEFLLKALPAAARYDVNNIWAECTTGRGQELVLLASKAPLFPRQPLMWFEYKNHIPAPYQTGRLGFLMVWKANVSIPGHEEIKHQYCILRMVENKTGRAYDIIGSLGLDENYNPLGFSLDKSIESDEAKATMESVMVFLVTVVGLLNWDRSVVSTTTVDMTFTNFARKRNGKHALSSPTVIDTTALRQMRARTSTGTSNSDNSGVCYHPVAGHLRRVSPLAPLFGKAPVPGKTCGVLRIKPHFRGNPEHGIKPQATYVLKASALQAG